ncbi:MAG: hypothetical protein Q8N23_27985 [Archangium sp.]|nr:hypothetical protein [Archangium sp.]MDP3156544.1 hypothetical protein [Archangium sp.]MDP3573887.1 hypothetical protein [Archangium sp.]
MHPRSLPAAALACTLLLAGLSGCDEDDFFHDSEWDIEVEDFDWDEATRFTDEDGDEVYTDEATVKLTQGKRSVGLRNEVAPASRGGGMVLTVSDADNQRVYSFDPTQNALSIAAGTDKLTVVQNPDKSYTVDGVAAANGKAAVALLKQSPVYNDASAWGFALTYSVCQSCLTRNAARQPICCYNCGSGGPAADPPAVCDVMRDLCDCAACDKLGKTSCPKCP